MIKLEKWHNSKAKHSCNYSGYCVIKISSILHNAYVIFSDQKKIMFYINNYINWNQFNQLLALDWLQKDIQNIDVVAQKLKPTSITVINLKRKKARKK